MAEPFFGLLKNDQAGLIALHAKALKMQPFIVEKDIWVCWALNKLFAMPDRMKMAFKGGTSLSKVYRAIDRFSEDIDVTIDYREFAKETTGSETRSELSRLAETLKAELNKYANANIKPYFESELEKEFDGKPWKVELDPNGEKLFIHYPSAIESSGYLESSVLLEFGVRNVAEPFESHTVKTYIAEEEKDVIFPEAKVAVLALLRTYWEKATLAHVEYHRTEQRKSAARWSRHWYDLYQLSGDLNQICADKSHDILNQVVKHKKDFFHHSFANYDDCIAGGLRLVPKRDLRELLALDFESMINAGMFYKEPPKFDIILERLQKVEDEINESRRPKQSNRKRRSETPKK